MTALAPTPPATMDCPNSSVAAAVNVRAATINDLPDLVRWTLALHAEEKGPYDLPVHDDLAERLPPWLERFFTDPNALILIAEHQQQAVGFALGFIAGQPNTFTPYLFHGVIQLLWIEPALRKQGIAQMLCDYIEQVFKAHGVAYVDIQHTAGNRAAAGFWQAQHYTEVGITRRKFFD